MRTTVDMSHPSHQCVQAAADGSPCSAGRPVLGPAEELAALLRVLPLLQHVRRVLRSVAAHAQEPLLRGGDAEGVSGPVLSGGEAGQGQLACELTCEEQAGFIRVSHKSVSTV